MPVCPKTPGEMAATGARVSSPAAEAAAPAKADKKGKKKAPATAAERKQAKEELTSADGAASEEQIANLKTSLKKLMELDPDQESFVQSVAVKTEGFTKITADVCDQLIAGVADMLTAYETQEG